uniref:RNA-directed DNA polymerase n=1 Tax=Lygus hesperus TaxID=30085 RepID=A0A0A9W4W3_LYGHE
MQNVLRGPPCVSLPLPHWGDQIWKSSSQETRGTNQHAIRATDSGKDLYLPVPKREKGGKKLNDLSPCQLLPLTTQQPSMSNSNPEGSHQQSQEGTGKQPSTVQPHFTAPIEPCPHDNLPGKIPKPQNEEFARGSETLNVESAISPSSCLLTSVPAFTIPVVVNGKEGACLIDTGSQLTLVDRTAIQQGALRPTHHTVQGVSGTPLASYGESTCSFTFPECTSCVADALIVDLPPDLLAIIGLDFQRQYHAKLDIPKGTVSFSMPAAEDSKQCVCHTSSPYLVAQITTQIPPHTVAVLPALRKGNQITTGLYNLFHPQPRVGLNFARSLHGNDRDTIVMLHNSSELPVTVQKHSKLGDLVEAEYQQPASTCAVTTAQLEDQSQRGETSFLQLAASQARGFEHMPQFLGVIKDYEDVFSYPGSEKLGITDLAVHAIPTEDHPPVRTRQYKIPYKQRPIFDSIIAQQEKEGVIRKGTGAWQSPSLLVPKKTLVDGKTVLSWRMVIDFRKLNKITRPEFFPLPRVHECIDQMAGSEFFTTLDLKSGYHQVPVREEDIEKTGFSTHNGSWVFQRMPFGLSNAPATFQKMAAQLIQSLGSQRALAFLDDIVLFHQTWQKQLNDLSELLQLLRRHNLKLQLTKCHFLQKEVTYLGHRISTAGIQPDLRKIEAVRDFPIPNTVTKVKAFLGLCSYYRKFVKGFAREAKPLTDLTKQDITFEWGPSQQQAFDSLKEKLISPPILRFPEFTKEFILTTDASMNGLGAVLSQMHDNKEHPVAYASRALNKAESNYSATELELLAVVFAVRHFHQYLWGTNFTLVTDHAPLRYLHQMKDTNSRILRWSLLLEEYAYTPKYKAGANNQNADGLSRAFLTAPVKTIDPLDLKNEQETDPYCKSKWGQPGYPTTTQGLLARNTHDGLRILIPVALQQRALAMAHDAPQGGHCGYSKTLARLKSNCYWKNMARTVKEYVKSCGECAKRKNHDRFNPPLAVFSEPTTTFEAISVDIMGPLKQTPDGYKYILTILDQFSRFVQFYPLKTQTAEEVATKLTCHIGKFGACRRLLSDRGANFTSELIQHLCQFFQVDKIQTTAYHPAGNGRCERVHKTVAKILSHFINVAQDDWDVKLSLAELVVNSHRNETTTFAPYTVVFGKEMLLPAREDFTLQPTIEPYALHVEDLRETLIKLWDEVTKMQLANAGKLRHRKNKTRESPQLVVGDFVFLHTPKLGKGKTKKFSTFWSGPYKITEVHSPQNVTIKMGRLLSRVHTSRLKPYHRRNPPPTQEPSGTTSSENTSVDSDEEGELGPVEREYQPPFPSTPSTSRMPSESTAPYTTSPSAPNPPIVTHPYNLRRRN